MKGRLVAHRGFAAQYPENTLASVRAALKLGLKWVEIDAQLSLDGVPLVYHDPTLSRVSGRRGDLRRLAWNELKGLPAHEPGRFGARFSRERISSLARVAALFKGKGSARLFVELKEESLKRFGRAFMLSQVLAALGPAARRCILISFDEEVLAMARAATRLPLGPVLRRWGRLKSRFIRALKPEFVFCGTRRLPGKGSLKLKGSKLCVYEVPDPAEGRALVRRGVDLIETFAPQHYLGLKGGVR